MSENTLAWVIQDMQKWEDEAPRPDEWKMREWIGKLRKIEVDAQPAQAVTAYGPKAESVIAQQEPLRKALQELTEAERARSAQAYVVTERQVIEALHPLFGEDMPASAGNTAGVQDAARRILGAVGNASDGFLFAAGGRSIPIPTDQCMRADDLRAVCAAALASPPASASMSAGVTDADVQIAADAFDAAIPGTRAGGGIEMGRRERERLHTSIRAALEAYERARANTRAGETYQQRVARVLGDPRDSVVGSCTGEIGQNTKPESPDSGASATVRPETIRRLNYIAWMKDIGGCEPPEEWKEAYTAGYEQKVHDTRAQDAAGKGEFKAAHTGDKVTDALADNFWREQQEQHPELFPAKPAQVGQKYREVWIPNSDNHIPRSGEGFENCSKIAGRDCLTPEQRASGQWVRFVEVPAQDGGV